MKINEFDQQMNRLTATYGKTPYGQERVALIWREVEHLSVYWFTEIVSEFIGSHRQAPLLPDFKQSIDQERERQGANRLRQNHPQDWNRIYSCSYCKDSGVYVCMRKEQDGLWAFRCHCDKGSQDLRRQIPQFKSGHEKEFCYVDIVKYREQLATGF